MRHADKEAYVNNLLLCTLCCRSLLVTLLRSVYELQLLMQQIIRYSVLHFSCDTDMHASVHTEYSMKGRMMGSRRTARRATAHRQLCKAITSRDHLIAESYLVLVRHAHISVHEKLLMVHVLLHSSIHELEGIQQARQLAYRINGYLKPRAETFSSWGTHHEGAVSLLSTFTTLQQVKILMAA